MHGAGMANTLYMKPGSVVVEVVPYYDSRHAPVTGIFPRVSSITAHHHFTYMLLQRDNHFDPYKMVAEIVKFYKKVKLWE
jgi:hypothetical protein